jgi:hypothetical protein
LGTEEHIRGVERRGALGEDAGAALSHEVEGHAAGERGARDAGEGGSGVEDAALRGERGGIGVVGEVEVSERIMTGAGLKPSGALSERARPRRETKAAVTRTQQRVTSTSRSRSRMARRRPTDAVEPADLMAPSTSAPAAWRAGARAQKKPAASESARAKRKTAMPGSTTMATGKSKGGR